MQFLLKFAVMWWKGYTVTSNNIVMQGHYIVDLFSYSAKG